MNNFDLIIGNPPFGNKAALSRAILKYIEEEINPEQIVYMQPAIGFKRLESLVDIKSNKIPFGE